MRVGVIGGGIQGTCLAMELVTRGVDVDLIEASPVVMDGASRHNEGKIHLGFVYANDPSYRTAQLMIRAADRFQPLMRRWLGSGFDDLPVSTPFNYAVHVGSLLSADHLAGIYSDIGQMMRGMVDGSYFGVEDPDVVVRLGRSDHGYGPAVDTVFSTRELALHPDPLADLVAKTVADAEGIGVLTGATVIGADVAARRLEIAGLDGTTTWLGPYDHIVNCAWGGRPAIDEAAGLGHRSPWTFRMKYFLLASAPAGLQPIPSTTVVLGSFGDIVDYGNGEHYLSWYPAGRLGWSTDLAPPKWPTRPDIAVGARIAGETLANLESVLPAVSRFTDRFRVALDVRGGVIYALGATDLDDPDSELHTRSKIGLRSQGRYHSVDTGKYTTAPLFAVQAADRITGAA